MSEEKKKNILRERQRKKKKNNMNGINEEKEAKMQFAKNIT